MRPLILEGQDELAFEPSRASGTVDRIDLILHVPERLKDELKLAPKKEVEEPGREMSEEEIYRRNYQTPKDFVSLGWTGENLKTDKGFGVDVFRLKQKK